MNLNFKIIFNILGVLLIINSIFMLLCLPFSLYHEDGAWDELIKSAVITSGIGLFSFFTTKNHNQHLKKRDGYLIVSFGWLIISLSSTLPYLFSGSIPNFTDAFFESVSGYTTTGASVLNNIEEIPIGILTWRSFTQWIGGMGIIVLTVAIVPLLGMGGIQLFSAESPGLSPDKLKPRITDTAKRLWIIYVGLTVLQTFLLMFGEMDFTDAFNHSLTTLATGGFSTKQDSIAFFQDSYTHYVIIVFMFLAGTNFSVTYLMFNGLFKKVWENEEFRYYLFISLLTITVVCIVNSFTLRYNPENEIRDSIFQVVSIITTTGFVTANYTTWGSFIVIILLLLMFVGGSAGSTAGGVKIIRHLVFFKNSFLEFRRQLHPHGIIPVRINGKAIPNNTTFNVLAFMMIYLIIFTIGTLVMAASGTDFMTSIGAVATSLGNIGPGLGTVGPVDNFAHISTFGKWVLSFLMLLGRLELFTLLLLLTPNFWKDY